MNEKSRNAVLVLSMLVSLSLVSVSAYAYWNNKDTGVTPKEITLRDVSQDELERSNGKMGQPCLVAVDGKVYKIEGFSLWQDGEHTPSEGQAYCGADMTEAINESPHGKKKLDQLDEIGRLVD